MAARSIKVFRGTVWLASSVDETALPGTSRRYEPTRWIEQSFEAVPSTAPARFVAVRHVCQTASGASFFAFLGASYQPAEGRELRVRVGVGDHIVGGLPDREAAVVQARLAQEVGAWPERPSGAIVVEHALFHEVDTKDWAWRSAAALAAALLRPGTDRLDEAQIVALGDRYLRDRE